MIKEYITNRTCYERSGICIDCGTYTSRAEYIALYDDGRAIIVSDRPCSRTCRNDERLATKAPIRFVSADEYARIRHGARSAKSV